MVRANREVRVPTSPQREQFRANFYPLQRPSSLRISPEGSNFGRIFTPFGGRHRSGFLQKACSFVHLGVATNRVCVTDMTPQGWMDPHPPNTHTHKENCPPPRAMPRWVGVGPSLLLLRGGDGLGGRRTNPWISNFLVKNPCFFGNTKDQWIFHDFHENHTYPCDLMNLDDFLIIFLVLHQRKCVMSCSKRRHFANFDVISRWCW